VGFQKLQKQHQVGVTTNLGDHQLRNCHATKRNKSAAPQQRNVRTKNLVLLLLLLDRAATHTTGNSTIDTSETCDTQRP